MRRSLSAACLFCLTVASAAASAQQPAIVRQRLQVTLGGGFVTEAEYTRPADVRGAVPAVLLVHGSTPADMDFTMARRGNDTVAVLREIADSLARHGIAAIRYHKRWVSGPGRVDFAKFAATDLQGLAADARTMLATLRAQPGVDSTRIYAWGWSEGSAIVSHLAATRAPLAGVIAHGPVVGSFSGTLAGQFRRVGVPYLLRFAAADSTMALEEISRAADGPGGMLARSHAMMLLDPMAAQRGERRLSTMMDRDKNGRIHVMAEAAATYEAMMAGPMLGFYAEGRALPGWAVMADSVRIPVLVLQGEADANIPVADVRRLAAQFCGRKDATVLVFPGLGHTLGAASDPVDDDFRHVAMAPIADAARWMRDRGVLPRSANGVRVDGCAAAR